MTLGRIGRSAAHALAAALAAPLAAAAILAAAGVIDGRELLATRTVLAWLAAATLAAAAGAAIALAKRRVATALACAAAAAALGHGSAWLALRGEATIDAGEGEESPPVRWTTRGPFASLPPVRALALPERRSGSARLAVGGREMTAPLGREVAAGAGLALTVEDVQVAPAFVVRHGSGAEAAGLLKLVPGVRDWFETAPLPHRFYATLPPATGDEVALRGPIHVRIQRGKIRVAEQDVAVGAAVQVEGVSLAFGEGARWVRIRVRRTPPPWFLVAAALVAAAAAATKLRRRDRTRAGGSATAAERPGARSAADASGGADG